jgi:hypothetical protein
LLWSHTTAQYCVESIFLLNLMSIYIFSMIDSNKMHQKWCTSYLWYSCVMFLMNVLPFIFQFLTQLLGSHTTVEYMGASLLLPHLMRVTLFYKIVSNNIHQKWCTSYLWYSCIMFIMYVSLNKINFAHYCFDLTQQ